MHLVIGETFPAGSLLAFYQMGNARNIAFEQLAPFFLAICFARSALPFNVDGHDVVVRRAYYLGRVRESSVADTWW
jgi:hypothetical protein